MPLGLTAEQLDAYCASSYTLEGALEAWTSQYGPHQWNVWQKNFFVFVRRYEGRDPQAACPEELSSSRWAVQVWKEVSEAVYGPEWRTLTLRKSAVDSAAELRSATPIQMRGAEGRRRTSNNCY